MLDRWKAAPAGLRWGLDDVSYKKAIAFLDHEGWSIEDWGCGGGYAKRFVQHGYYRGIDGSGTPDVKADLTEYTSSTDALLLRHVLEHNHQWERVLSNAMRSFHRRMAVVIFTPFSARTCQITVNLNGAPDLSFAKGDLTRFFPCYKEEALITRTQYGQETIFYVSKE